jgi:hypothetical protein
MGDVHVISTADSLCGSHAGQHNFQLFVVAVKSHPSVLSSIGSEYTKVFECPKVTTAQN